MKIEICLSVLCALCIFRVFDFMVFTALNEPQKRVTKNIEVYCGKDEDLPNVLKELIKRAGKDDDDDQ